MIVAHINLAKGFRGGERQTVLLIEHLAHLEVEQQYLVCRKDSPMRALVAHVPNLKFVDANHQLQGHFCISKAQVVHAHDAKGVHWAWLQYKIHSRPYILTRRIDNLVKNKRFNQMSYKSASARVAISGIIQTNLEERNWGVIDKIADAYSCLQSNSEHTVELSKPFAGKFLVGQVGALRDEHKGQRVLLDVAEQLEKSHPDIQFLFYGQGSDEQSLKQESKHLTNVCFQGFVDYIGDVMPMLDILAFPSRMEGLGSTILDAMYFNVPVIASKVGGIPDVVIHEKTGLLFNNGSSQELKAGIVKLYENPDAAKKLVEGAKNLLHQYSPQEMAGAYLKLYQQSIEPIT